MVCSCVPKDSKPSLPISRLAPMVPHFLDQEEHSSTADSYHSLGITQHKVGNFSSALKSKQRALDIRLKLFGDQNLSTADSYFPLTRGHTT